jgi:hypothetical protein
MPGADKMHRDRQASQIADSLKYELLDTGVFDDDRYFDTFLEYAKQGPEDVLIRVTVHNRGPETARLRLLPTLWFRNTWSWGDNVLKPSLLAAAPSVIETLHPDLGQQWLYCDGGPELLFTDNDTNVQRLWAQPNPSPWVKDAFHSYVIGGDTGAVNPDRTGTKAAAHYVMEVAAGGSAQVRLRLTGTA